MSPEVAAYVGVTLSFSFAVALAFWHLVPRLRERPLSQGLSSLLWVHTGRIVALQVFSAQRAGLAVSDAVRDRIAHGDLASAILAFIAIAALRRNERVGLMITWVFSAVGVLDLVSSTIGGVQDRLFVTANNLTWLIVVFYVNILWVTHALVVWLLVRAARRLA